MLINNNLFLLFSSIFKYCQVFRQIRLVTCQFFGGKVPQISHPAITGQLNTFKYNLHVIAAVSALLHLNSASYCNAVTY